MRWGEMCTSHHVKMYRVQLISLELLKFKGESLCTNFLFEIEAFALLIWYVSLWSRLHDKVHVNPTQSPPCVESIGCIVCTEYR